MLAKKCIYLCPSLSHCSLLLFIQILHITTVVVACGSPSPCFLYLPPYLVWCHFQGLKSPLKLIGYNDGMSHVEARYPAILFKQQLTACVEKIFGHLRDNLKKELSPLLALCIQVGFLTSGI
jgi:myosin V